MAGLLWFTVISWLVSPIISFFVNKLLSSCLDFSRSRKLRELKNKIIPSLEKTLAEVTKQRMLIAAKDQDKGYGSHLENLGELARNLKSAFYDAEDVLDVVEYHRIKKHKTSISSWVLQAIGDCIACCKRSSFGQKLRQCAQNQNQKLSDLGDKLQQCAKDLDLKFWDLLAKLQQYAQNLNQMFGGLRVRAAQSLPLCNHQGAAGQPREPAASAAEFMDDIEQGTAAPSPAPDAPSTSNPPTPNAIVNSAGSATEFRGDNHHGSAEEAPSDSLVQMICNWLVYGFSALRSLYSVAGHLRDCSYEPVGIKSDGDTIIDWFLYIIEIISLWKRINNIEYIVSESQISPLLDQNSSSSTPKDADKESSSSDSTIKNRESSSKRKEIGDLPEEEVIGRAKVRAVISQMLHDGRAADAASSSTGKPYSVIGIYGIPGSGKSTLAKYVSEYEKRERHFNHIMFIYVGKTFSMGDIFRDMLEQIILSDVSNNNRFLDVLQQIMQTQLSIVKYSKGLKKELKGKDLNSLKTDLKKILKDRCFLLVLDDFWVNNENPKQWDDLLDTLKAARSGSRILVTAQKSDAAGALGAPVQPFSIPDLEEKDYLSLLMHHAGTSAGDDNYEIYESIGERIANRLLRSPIAAVTVGKQLQMNKTIHFWKNTARVDVLNETIGALWWSYQQLGVDIRRCFAYCSTFPSGYEFQQDELVHIWIAQGFIKASATEEMEDIGQIYIRKLVTFSFLQVRRTILGTEVFTLHDLLHELADKVAESEFYRIGSNWCPTNIPREVRHLFVSTGTENRGMILEKILDLVNLRTLIINEHCTNTAEMPIDDLRKFFESLFTKLTKLRVLAIKIEQNIEVLSKPIEIVQRNNHDLQKVNIIKDLSMRAKNVLQMMEQNCDRKLLSVPACIDRMKHLRYLGFHFHNGLFDLNLPSTFSKLYHMQIIDIPCLTASCPEYMANLRFLRHIYSPLSFPNIGMLTSLQTLTCFVVKEEQGYGLKQLMQLNKLQGTLSIQGLGTVRSKEKALEANLRHKEGLRELALHFHHRNGDPDVEAEVLEGLYPTKNLKELTIWHYKGSSYPRGTKQLCRLTLIHCRQLASIPKDHELFFGLRELHIYACDWDMLPENMEHLVLLHTLEIMWCHKVELLPTLPKALKKIVISQCKLLSKTCEEEGHQNCLRIKDIKMKKIW